MFSNVVLWNDGEDHLNRWREKCSITKSALIILDPRTSKAQLAATREVTVIKKEEYSNTNTVTTNK